MNGPELTREGVLARLIATGEVSVPGFGRFVIRDRGDDRQLPSFQAEPALMDALEGAPHGLPAPWSEVVSALRDGQQHEVDALGTFAVREQRGYRTRDPRTGEPVQVPPTKTVRMTLSRAWRDGARRRIPPCEHWLGPAAAAPPPPGASAQERTPADVVGEIAAGLSYLVPEGPRRASVVAELQMLEPDLDVASLEAQLDRILARSGSDRRTRPLAGAIEARPEELASMRAQLDHLRRAAVRHYGHPREHHRVVAATLEVHRQTTGVLGVTDPLAYTHIALQDTLGSSPEVAAALPRIGDFHNARILTLFGNDLVGLPIPTARLSELRALHLAQNQLVTLPEALYACEALEWLDLSDNPLRSVPDGIERWRSLRYLGLRRTELSAPVVDELRARLPDRCMVES